MRMRLAIGGAVAVIALSFVSMSAALSKAQIAKTMLIVLISIRKTIPHGLLWSVLGTHYQTLGTATETTSRRGTVWKFKFALASGTLRTDWYFTGGAGRRLVGSFVAGVSGTFTGLGGSATVHGVTQSGALTRRLEGVPYLEVGFHLS
jgi:hypothetical protein